MRRHTAISFFFALIIYAPVLIASFWTARLFERTSDDRVIALPRFISDDSADLLGGTSFVAPAPFAPASSTPAATAIDKSDDGSDDHSDQLDDPAESDKNAEKSDSEPLTVAQLNDIFAPAAPAVSAPYTEIALPNMPTISASELGELYGLTLFDLTPEERKFLDTHLNPIQTITQRYLWQRGYPSLAVNKRMSGDVILSFTLQPNGDITPIETVRNSGWSLLDDHAKETIRAAYKEYPHPPEPVRVRMRVVYRLN